VHIVCKDCIDRGELTSEKIRRDSIEPSSLDMQGLHRKNYVLISEEDRVTEHSIRRIFARCASSKENARRARRIYFQEILQI
jgi:hypothetical protein